MLTTCILATGITTDVGQLPVMGWTSWVTDGQGAVWMGSPFNVTANALKAQADHLVSSGLADAGYNYILIDDGWPACYAYDNASHFGPASSCAVPPPRLEGGAVEVDAVKFPPTSPGANDGVKVVADYVHSKGLRLGIYTAPHAQTCGGFTGMLGHEATDAALFAAWGIDFAKLDLGCRSDTSIHDGTAIAALQRVSDGLNATGRPIVFYIDAGNPTAGPKVVNPHRRGMPDTVFTRTHVADTLGQAVWSWGPNMAHTWKVWFDRHDNFASLMSNVEVQVAAGLAWWQTRGAVVNTDMLTVGRGGYAGGKPGMTEGQCVARLNRQLRPVASLHPWRVRRCRYRVEVFLYAMLSAPLVLSFDLATLGDPSQAAG